MKIMQNSISLIILLVLLALNGCQKQDASAELKPIIDTFNEAWNTGNFASLDAVVDSLYTKHTATGPIVGLEALKQTITDSRVTYPDWNCTYVEEIYSGDKAVVRFEITGTNTGPGIIPPTGKKITVEGMAIFRIADGKIVEDRSAADMLPVVQALGYTLIPPSVTED